MNKKENASQMDMKLMILQFIYSIFIVVFYSTEIWYRVSA